MFCLFSLHSVSSHYTLSLFITFFLFFLHSASFQYILPLLITFCLFSLYPASYHYTLPLLITSCLFSLYPASYHYTLPLIITFCLFLFHPVSKNVAPFFVTLRYRNTTIASGFLLLHSHSSYYIVLYIFTSCLFSPIKSSIFAIVYKRANHTLAK